MQFNLHNPNRELIELRMEHADLDVLIDRCSTNCALDELMVKRLKRKRLALKDAIVQLERHTDPQQPA